jgi:SAM-dependent methyltransferase
LASQTLKAALDRLGLLPAGFSLARRVRSFRMLMRAQTVPKELLDGFPVPPPDLLESIGGDTTAAAYLHGGAAISSAMRRTLTGHDVVLRDLGAILDFGCGCGRLLRQFRDLAPAVELHGCDYNADAVAWCASQLPFGRFRVNALDPPLSYSEASFGLVYAFSVFTHLTHELQVAWSRELRRLLRSGGYALLTVSSSERFGELTPAERAVYLRGELVVRFGSVAGTNLCAAFHPPEYIARVLASGWQLVETLPSEVGQTFVVLRKPQ